MGKYQEEARFFGETGDGIPINEGAQFEDYMAPQITFDYYQRQAKITAGEHTTQLDAIQNWTLGLSGEAGEFANIVKKAIYHNHGFPYGELISELGDVLWYVAQLCTSLGIDMDMVAEQNLKKLAKRYPHGFNPEDSINREE